MKTYRNDFCDSEKGADQLFQKRRTVKAIIKDKYIECYPTDSEFRELCRPGEGADTCIWISMGQNGMECCYFNRPVELEDMWRKGETTAKRDGCEKMKQFSPVDHPGKEIIF